ncbi:hypothetical protein OKW38_002468 [Paraburkholderia sp. MM5496-R1]
MQRFTNAIRDSVQNQNWYGALTLALTLPDVCGKLENLNGGSQARYTAWFATWLEPTYTYHVGPTRVRQIFLNGNDCYALRCSYLHEGAGNIEHQRAREALDRFHFITPPPNGNKVHCNRADNTLQLQVDIFSLDVANAVDRWAEAVAGNAEIRERMRSLLVIHDSYNGVRF